MELGDLVKTGVNNVYSAEMSKFLLMSSNRIGDGVLSLMSKFALFDGEIESWLDIKSSSFEPEFAIAWNIYQTSRRAHLLELVTEGTISDKTCSLLLWNSHGINANVPTISQIKQDTNINGKFELEGIAIMQDSLSSVKTNGF